MLRPRWGTWAPRQRMRPESRDPTVHGGTAIEHGLKVVTYDADLARLLGPSAELLRAS